MAPEVLSAIIAGSISLVVSAMVAAWAQRRKLESDYDVALRTERLAEYANYGSSWSRSAGMAGTRSHLKLQKNCLPISTIGILKAEDSCFRTSHTKALKNCSGRSISTMMCPIICAPLGQNFGPHWLMILAGENDPY